MKSHRNDDVREGRKRRAGMREVADRAGVAMSSVSRVLSGHPDVSPEMHERVVAAVDELGYRPHMLAQGLRSQRTFSVGFSVSDISNFVLASTVTGAERRLRRAGYSLLLTDSEGRPERDAAQIPLLEQRHVDGLLLSLADERHGPTAAVVREADVPLVLVDRDHPDGVDAPRAVFDHFAGMRDAAEHLVGLGHREVALILGGPRWPARERRRGLQSVIGGAGGRCVVLEGAFAVEHGFEATLAALDRRPRPTAIVTGGHILMHGALRALRSRGVAIGREMSFVGCDDVAVAEFHNPPIAIVHRDVKALGGAAAELLLELLEGRPRDDQADVTLPTEFIMRESCAPAPSA